MHYIVTTQKRRKGSYDGVVLYNFNNLSDRLLGTSRLNEAEWHSTEQKRKETEPE